MNAIETVGLTKRYGNREACSGVSLIVRQGEIFGFLGPNGAGKSTLVRMLLGLVRPDAGTARLLGTSFRDPAVRRRIGYLPELFRFPPWLTAWEVMELHARLLRLPPPHRPRVEATLSTVGLEGRGRDRVRSFSKGMQQRLGLAVALVGEPELLFLDEPTSALDPVGRHEVAQLLRRLREQGKTIFLNSHLLSDVEHLCDRVALIRSGRLLYTGGLEEALRARSRYRVAVGEMPAACRTELMAWDAVTVEEGPALLFTGPRSELPALHRLLARHQVSVYEVEPLRHSLEDWFLERLGGKGGMMDARDRPMDDAGDHPA